METRARCGDVHAAGATLKEKALPLTTIYSCVESSLFDLLSYHDSHLIRPPNSINEEDDGCKQMMAIAIMPSLLPLIHQSSDPAWAFCFNIH